MQRSNTLSSLSKKNLKHKATKPKIEEDKENGEGTTLPQAALRKHPAYRFIRTTQPTVLEYKKFATLLYKGLFYSVNNLKGPSAGYIRKKQVKLPEPSGIAPTTQTPSRSS